MRIGIGALTFEPGHSGGVETYFRNLIKQLQKIDQENHYFILMTTKNLDSLDLRSSTFHKLVVSEALQEKIFRKLRFSVQSFQETINKKIEKLGLDILHFPFQIIQPMGLNVRKILTFNDMQHEYWPEFFSPEDLEARRLTFRPSAEAATQIISISEFSKKTLVEKYKISPDKIKVIYETYDEELYNNPRAKTLSYLPKPYFYYPAATWPHKNHIRLIEAFEKFARKNADFNLVLSGASMQNNDEVLKRINELGLKDKVFVLGYLDYDELPLIYRGAFALVFPSLFEGFGIPLLEAFASSCPVICSNTTSLPEVAGNAALYFDPLNADDIAKKMQRLVDNPNLRKILIKQGSRRLHNFSQEKMARETLQVYEQVARL
jgi:glycosyltransferase involved in cell wall biosynthesis